MKFAPPRKVLIPTAVLLAFVTTLVSLPERSGRDSASNSLEPLSLAKSPVAKIFNETLGAPSALGRGCHGHCHGEGSCNCRSAGCRCARCVYHGRSCGSPALHVLAQQTLAEFSSKLAQQGHTLQSFLQNMPLSEII